MLHPPKAPSGLRVRQALGEETGRPRSRPSTLETLPFFSVSQGPARPRGRCVFHQSGRKSPRSAFLDMLQYAWARNRCRCILNRATSTRQCVVSKQGPRYAHWPSWTRRISAQRPPRPDFRKSALRRPEGRTPCRQARQRPRKAIFLPPCHARRLIRGAIQQTFYCSKSTPHNPLPRHGPMGQTASEKQFHHPFPAGLS